MHGNAIQRAVYNCTRLNGTDKKGVLKQDEDGYYYMVIGSLGENNQSGAYYDFHAAKAVFDKSGSLMRRVAAGQMRFEYGHPQREHWMTDDQYLDRIYNIDPNNICCHVRELVLEELPGGVIQISAWLKPYEETEKGRLLKSQLDNNYENVSFSIRCLSVDGFVGTRFTKHIKQVICWDYVIEPGIARAEKFRTPSLESLEVTMDNVVDMERYRQTKVKSGISLESSSQELVSEMKSIVASVSARPASARW